MQRNLEQLSEPNYDLLVIGGGIHGACVAWDAVLRGLRVALIEKDDFGAAASANSLKILHGGLRYLQSIDIRRMRESILERSIWLRIAPHLVRPVPFTVATHGVGKNSREAFRVALWLNDRISFDRNRNISPTKRIGEGRILGRTEALRLAPALESTRLTGAALWYDVQAIDSERLTLAFLLSATEQGATCANYVRFERFSVEGDRISGVHVRDTLADQEFTIRARYVINAAGAWQSEVARVDSTKPSNGEPLGLALNLVTRRLPGEIAFGVRSNLPHSQDPVAGGNRFLFFVPWRNSSLIGTFYRLHEDRPDRLEIGAELLQSAVDEVNDAVPTLNLRYEDVGFYHHGLLPLRGSNEPGSAHALAHRGRVIDHGADGGPGGLISIVGVKYTTARSLAERAIDLVCRRLDRSTPPCRTARIPIYGGAAELPADESLRDMERLLVARHGCRYGNVLAMLRREEGGLDPITEGATVLRGEIRHAVREEMAMKLTDLVFRRLGIGVERPPAADLLEEISRIMAAELAWSEEKRRQEIEEVARAYRPLRVR